MVPKWRSHLFFGPTCRLSGLSWGHLGAILGFSGAILGLAWSIFGPSSGHLEARLGFERTGEERKDKERTEMGQFSKNCTAPRREHHFRCSQEPCRGLLGAALGHLGFILGSWGDLGAIFGLLGAILGPSWGTFGPTWGILWPTWETCGPKVAFVS